MSQYFIAQNVANLYAKADTGSEVVSQAILGSIAVASDEEQDFVKVKTADNYGGWISKTSIVPSWDWQGLSVSVITKQFANLFSKANDDSELVGQVVVSTSLFIDSGFQDKNYFQILLPDKRSAFVKKDSFETTGNGDFINRPLLKEDEWGKMDFGQREAFVNELGENAVSNAKRLIGVPYLWGGCTSFGIDCSGLVQLCFKLSGLQLLRDADIQFYDKRFQKFELNNTLAKGDFQTGDIVVFGNKKENKITHTGLITGDGRFVHSRGGFGVRVDSCKDSYFNEIYMGAARLNIDANLTL